jgi:hypothetical protein
LCFGVPGQVVIGEVWIGFGCFRIASGMGVLVQAPRRELVAGIWTLVVERPTIIIHSHDIKSEIARIFSFVEFQYLILTWKRGDDV